MQRSFFLNFVMLDEITGKYFLWSERVSKYGKKIISAPTKTENKKGEERNGGARAGAA